MSNPSKNLLRSGFTVIELIVVLAAISILLSIAVPRYVAYLDKAKEVALRQNLVQLRKSISDFYNDTGRYPRDLKELLDMKYLSGVPVDPVTERNDTWIQLGIDGRVGGGLYDIRSGAKSTPVGGGAYYDW